MKYDWEHEYVAAILETDDARLPDRFSAAKLAIANRIDALNMNHGGAPEERAAIDAALTGLEQLRVERIGTE